jgi:antitoxin ParD1/3/4
MASSLNLSPTDKLGAFINQNSCEGMLYATPSELVRDILRRHKLQQEAAQVRDAIIEGYQDALALRTVAFDGDLKGLLALGYNRPRKRPRYRTPQEVLYEHRKIAFQF